MMDLAYPGPRRVYKFKAIDYGDWPAQFFLWQRAAYLIPLWALLIIPVAGLICRIAGPLYTQIGLGIAVALCAAYFVEDLLKRKIRFDDEYIFFGYRAIRISDLSSVELAYKKGKLLPGHIVLQSPTGPRLKLRISALSDQSVESFLKHLQARNSQLQTAPVLSTLIKCRRVSKKIAVDNEQRLELPYHSHRFFEDAVDMFKTTARQWIRMGPLLAFCLLAPVWLLTLTVVYSSLQPNHFWHAENLGTHQFLYHLMLSLQQHAFNLANWLANSVQQSLSQNAWLIVPALTVVVGFLAYLLQLLLKPNAIAADTAGLKLGMRYGYWFVPTLKVAWSEVTGASLFKGRKQDPQSWKLRLTKSTGKRVDLRMSAMDPGDKVRLLRRMERYMPNCNIDADLSHAMLPNAERSYTEIWLQSLSQAPERKTLEPLQPGQMLDDDRFEVLKKLGVGGQGTAYLCRDLTSGETVVLKETILPVFVEDSIRRSALERFENEARLLKSLDSQLTVRLMDYFIEDHRAYLVLEHIDGMSLRELVSRDGAVSQEQGIDLGLQMTAMLKLLHHHAIVHRDFTPDNLILNSEGRLKLIDFNVAQQLQIGNSGTIVGKHAYLPPEQFRGKATSQSDLYAFGATMFYILTGSDPEPITQSSPSSVNHDVSSVLDDVIKRSTFLQPAKRFETAAQIEAALLTLANDGVANEGIVLSPANDAVVLSLKEKEINAHG
jgi:tRNA A-37 threonylcarbamoyl transferase component Bud32